MTFINVTPVAPTSLRILADQPSTWKNHNRTPISPAVAAELVLRADAEDGRRRDVSDVDLTKCRVRVGDTGNLEIGRDKMFLPVRDHAFAQLCQQIGAPSRYLRELPAATAIDAIGWGLREKGREAAMLRLAGPTVRAIVSAKYAPLDNDMLLESFSRFAGQFGVSNVVQIATGTTTTLRAVSDFMHDGPDGKGLRAGVMLRNSEIGESSVEILAFVERLVCTNGMTVSLARNGARFRHFGDTRRIHDGMRTALPLALESANDAIERLNGTANVRMSLAEVRAQFEKMDLTAAVVDAAFREALAEAEVIDVNAPADVVRALPETTEVSLWNVINGITGAARSRSVAERLSLEAVASSLAA